MNMTEYEELMNDTRLFYRLPKRLFEDPAFEEMSIDAKIISDMKADHEKVLKKVEKCIDKYLETW